MRAWKIAVAGALGGAVLAVAIVLALAAGGLVPVNDRQMQGYLMAHPSLAQAMMARQQDLDDMKKAAQQANAVAKLGSKAFFDPRIAFVTGPANARNTVVEFYDYDCPYCRASLPEVKKYYRAHKDDTRFAFIELPLSIHGPNALLAAQASLAARHQPDKYLALHFALLGSDNPVDADAIYATAAKVGLDMQKLKADMSRPEIMAAIKQSRDLAMKAGIDGTPTFIVNGQMHPGMVEDGNLEELAKS